MSIKLSPYDLNALLGISDTNVVSTTGAVSDTKISSTKPISDTKTVSSTKVSDTKISDTKPVSSTNPISDTKISATNGQKMNAWKKANRDTVRLEFPKGEKERLKAEAARRGMSLTALVKAALAEYLERRPGGEEAE